MEQGTILRSFDSALGGANLGEVFPMFQREAVQNHAKSLEAGRPIFDTVEMIQIVIPGDNKNSPVRLIKEDDKVRFAAAYERFKKEEALVFDGTPIDAWPRLATKQVYELKALGFYTVESLAACSDANLSKLGMGGLMLRDMAKAYIEAARNGGQAERLVAENAQLRTDMAAMTQTIEALTHKIEKLAKDTKTDITKVNVDGALSLAREQSRETSHGDLPDGWEGLGAKEMIALASTFNFAVPPRNKAEAHQLLSEYQGKRDALKQR